MNTEQESINYIASSDFKMIDPPTDETIGMWRDLFKQSHNFEDVLIDEPWRDPLTNDERDLLTVLTKRLASHFALLGFSEIIKDDEK